MASKGQKFNQYTQEFKLDLVLQHLNENKSFGQLSKVYGISKGTIKGWVYKYKSGNTLSEKNRDRSKQEKEIDYKEKYEILKNYQAFLKAQREKK